MKRRRLLFSATLAMLLAFGLPAAKTLAAGTDVPAPGESPRIDAIKERGTLRVAAIGEFPWLPENTSGSGAPFSGPAWTLAQAYADRLGVTLEVVPVSHETKVPILATDGADITIAPLAVTPSRQEVVDFIVYSKSSLCLFGLESNDKLTSLQTVDDLNNPDIVIAYFTGTPPETWLPERLPNAQAKGVAGSGANAPVEEILAKRADLAPIDNVAWPKLAKQVGGLVVFPRGDGCLASHEMATDIGIAIDKNQPVYLAWLRAVEAEMAASLENEEIELLKSAE